MRRAKLAVAAIVVVTLTAVSGCSSSPDVSGTPSQRVQGWLTGVGFTASSAKIASELDEVTRTANAGDLGGLQAVCVQLQDDATIAHAQLPSPDQSLTSQLDTAYQTAYQLANHYLDKGVGPNRAAGLSSIVHQADVARQALHSGQTRAAMLANG